MPIDYEWKNIICSYFVLEGKKSRLVKKSHNLKVCTPPLEEKNTGIKKINYRKSKNCKYCTFSPRAPSKCV